jgi:hypothetical protein
VGNGNDHHISIIQDAIDDGVGKTAQNAAAMLVVEEALQLGRIADDLDCCIDRSFKSVGCPLTLPAIPGKSGLVIGLGRGQERHVSHEGSPLVGPVP